MLRRASEVSAELIDYGSKQCAAQPLREKEHKESGHQEGLQDATGPLFHASWRISWKRLELHFNLLYV